MKPTVRENCAYSLVSPTSMGVRITPLNHQPVHVSDHFFLQATSAESNVLTVSAALGERVKVLTTFVKDSPIALLIKNDLRKRGIEFEGKDVPQGGPWGYRHQFNIADTGYGVRGPRVTNDRAGEVGRTLNVKDFDLERLFGREGVRVLHVSGLIAALSPETGQFCIELARAAKSHGTLISFDLNYRESFWKGRGEELHSLFSEIASLTDYLIGNEEDFQLALGVQGPEAGGADIAGKMDSFKGMIDNARKAIPKGLGVCHNPSPGGERQRTRLGRHPSRIWKRIRGTPQAYSCPRPHWRRRRVRRGAAVRPEQGVGAGEGHAVRMVHGSHGYHHDLRLRHARERRAGLERLGRQRPGKTVGTASSVGRKLEGKRSCAMKKSDIGLIGLAVMGENLVMNMESRGYTVSVFNRTADKVSNFIEGRAKGKNILGTFFLEDLVASLERPRKIMMMVQAGKAVDEMIEHLLPLVEKGDILIDGGNSHFSDTIRRTAYVESKGLLYIGTGVSGGEEGALKGPSMMPGGSAAAWPHVKDIFQSISARVEDGTPCCEWMGADGAGHFVKMVHNGIEYGDMQMICETYQMMKEGLGMSNEEMHDVFAEWNRGELDSYLIEITRDILGYKDEDGNAVVDLILDTAGQKGTGKWTAIAALDEGQPLTLIGEAVFARCLSALKEERVEASKQIKGQTLPFSGDKKAFVDDLRKALYAAKIVSYAQGYQLMRSAAKTYGWNLNYGGVALMWRGGCIIRSVFLGKIKEAFDKNPNLSNLLLDPFFKDLMKDLLPSWRDVAATAIRHGIPIPSMSSGLAYFDGYTSEFLPANLLQAQRDYFGAHMYQRLDTERGRFFHTNWTEREATPSQAPMWSDFPVSGAGNGKHDTLRKACRFPRGVLPSGRCRS